ncbi:hypothetical protein LSAT2_023630 [Lamellibrachia satsuma]|nr:hypothetical protein LSAT2_023630 [Lamellibrachia satsuma]
MSRQGYVTYKHILTSFLQRIEKLEAEVPQLKTRRMKIIKQHVEELNCKLVFLNKRFDQASHTDWKGMFHKPPLW